MISNQTTKRLLRGLLQLPSGNSCAAAGGNFKEILKIFSATKRRSESGGVFVQLRLALHAHHTRLSSYVLNVDNNESSLGF